MIEWVTSDDPWRTWRRITTDVRWTSRGGALAARKGVMPIDLNAAPALTTARVLAGRFAPGIRQVVAGDEHAAFYVRALLSLISIECPAGKLPCYGDCRIAGKPVPCGKAGADAPRSVGLYQFLRGTAAKVGARWNELAGDELANHRAAFKLAKSLEAEHGFDFPTLAVLWNAGSVRADTSNEWGVHLWSKDLLTKYARAWNAQNLALAELGGGDTPSSSSSSGGGLLAAIVGALLLGACTPTEQRIEHAVNDECRALLAAGVGPDQVRAACVVDEVATELLDAATRNYVDAGADR